nr:porin [uncultured Gellertiella sp.]
MNIKSLLLGSAAALAVVSGAHAADAIVAAEPEPAEYVKVCDAFGTGYFYIPGTETCLKIGGLVRYEVKGGDLYRAPSGWSKSSRFQLNVSTASDTEYGALKTKGVIQFNNYNGTDGLDLNAATISLGGLTIGQDDSLFTTATGYAGNVLEDFTNVGYGPFDTQQIRYTYDNGAGFTIAAALEHDPSTVNIYATDEKTGEHVKDAAGNDIVIGTKGGPDDDYVPNLTAAVTYSAGDFGFSAAAGYDERASAGAIKARVDGKFGAVSAFLMAGYNTGDTPNHYAAWNGDWALWAGLSANVSDSVALNAAVNYDQAKDLDLAFNAAFTVASGFTITPEIDYAKAGGGDGIWGGIVRFDRNF